VQGILIDFLVLVAPLAICYPIGRYLEKKHFASIRAREERLLNLPAITFQKGPAAWDEMQGELVAGSVVVSLDYFKRFVATLRGLVGGRVGAYETLMDRGRREAVLRMKRQAELQGAEAIVNVRIETSRLASGRADGKGTAGVEVLAFGTALRKARA